MNTKNWGPPLWESLFMFAANYPITIKKTKEHTQLKNHYKNYYTSLKYMLPCKYCRMSYKTFLKELPIEPYLTSRKCLMYWLYLIKDKVNTKLIHHEEILIQELEDSDMTNKEKKKIIKGVFRTTPSPTFESVCKYYEQFRAKCSKKTKSCSIPVKARKK